MLVPRFPPLHPWSSLLLDLIGAPIARYTRTAAGASRAQQHKQQTKTTHKMNTWFARPPKYEQPMLTTCGTLSEHIWITAGAL
eukprot:15659966-Heterocapsa_arctica.AAC.1